MKKNTQILSEVHRVLDLMGLQNISEDVTLIDEQPTPTQPIAQAAEWLKPLFKSLKNQFKSLLKKDMVVDSRGQRAIYKFGDRKIEKAEFDNLIDLFSSSKDDLNVKYNEFIKIKPGETQIDFKARLAQLIDDLGPDYQNAAYERFMQGWFKAKLSSTTFEKPEITSELSFYKALSKYKKTKGDDFDLTDFLNTELKIDDPLDQQVLIPKIEKRLREFETNPTEFKNSVKKPIETSVTPLGEFEKMKLFSFLKDRTFIWSKFREGFKKILDEYEQEILATVKEWEKEAAEIVLSSKGSSSNSTEALRTLSAVYAQKISTILAQAKIKFGDDAIKILEDSGLPEDILRWFKGKKEPFFAIFDTFFQMTKEIPTDKKGWSKFKELVGSTKELVGSTIKSFALAFEGFYRTISKYFAESFWKGVGKIFKDLINPFTQIGGFFWTKTWGSFSNLYGLLVKHGAFQKNPNLKALFRDAFIYTWLVGVVSYFVDVIWEISKELFWKPISLGLNYFICSDRAKNIFGEGFTTFCYTWDKLDDFERTGTDAVKYLIPDAIGDAWNKKFASMGAGYLILDALPVVSVLTGFVERAVDIFFFLRYDVPNLIKEAKKKTQELQKEAIKTIPEQTIEIKAATPID